jgi:hypothetical protein
MADQPALHKLTLAEKIAQMEIKITQIENDD